MFQRKPPVALGLGVNFGFHTAYLASSCSHLPAGLDSWDKPCLLKAISSLSLVSFHLLEPSRLSCPEAPLT